MNEWDATSYAGKDTILRVVRDEAERLFALAEPEEAREAPTDRVPGMGERGNEQAVALRGIPQKELLDFRVSVGPGGMTYQTGDLTGMPTVIEFDAGNMVLATFGRSNAGTVRGDLAIADRFLNLFFRI
ncbi:hypothetical protein EDD27_4978 [Nonomuraea polychroma]|uniref:SCP-2 sterol transfer family protein n=1 Tax=Nonomuraea polychroma TaxID=46176 RepID=A0A438M9H2_9ACTN|nr:hypothetical protein [Nonomuraea polychroma]RVX42354.1 hypothetical protein EDD27_4978 [Nonomuraea polychroma]